ADEPDTYAEVATIDDQGGEHPLVSASGYGEVVVSVWGAEDEGEDYYARSMHLPSSVSPIMGVRVTPTVIAGNGTDVYICVYSDVDMEVDLPDQAGLTVQMGGEEPIPTVYDADTHSYSATVSAVEGAHTLDLALAGSVFASVEFTPMPTSAGLVLSSCGVCETVTAGVLVGDSHAEAVCGLEGVTLRVGDGVPMGLEEGPSEAGCTYSTELTLPCDIGPLEFSVDTGLEGVGPFTVTWVVTAGDIDPDATLATLDTHTPLRTSASSVLLFVPTDSYDNTIYGQGVSLPTLVVSVTGTDGDANTYLCTHGYETERYECVVNIPATADDYVTLTFGRRVNGEPSIIPFGDPIQQRVLGETVSLTPVILLCMVSLLVSGYAVYASKHKGGYSELLPSIMVSPVRKDD
ncbi:hypothetical protein KIPB_010385, partial [Kipferlia bialata]